MATNHRKYLPISVIALASLLVVGCSSAAPEKTTPPTKTPSQPEKTVEPTEDPGTDGDADLTEPGTELAFGETATVTFSSGTDVKDQPVEVTVTGVAEGKIEDFTAAGLDEDFTKKLDGYSTYYVTIEATKSAAATAELAYTDISQSFGAVDANDNSMSPVSIIGDFAPCDSTSFSEKIDSGTTETTCIIVAAPAGVKFGAATYEANDTPYDSYDGKPVRWK